MPASRPTDPAALFEAARGGDQASLARLLSLVERGGPRSREVAGLAYTTPGDAYTVGITGAPGAGKSTLTDRLVTLARQAGPDGGDRVAVLAVDPSSPYSGGAILGDRVRMPSHALDDRVYIRSMATRGHLGGLAVVNPGWGDAIQANKAGLLEVADLFVINKADRPGARQTRRDLELMLDLTELGPWRPAIVETVASAGDGVDELWATIGRHRDHQIEQGTLAVHRRQRLEREFRQILAARLRELTDGVLAGGGVDDIVRVMLDGEVDPYEAADRLVDRVMPSDPTAPSDSRD